MFTEFFVKKVILDSGGNYLFVKEVAGSFAKIGAPYSTISKVGYFMKM